MGGNTMRDRPSATPARLPGAGCCWGEENCLCGHRRVAHGLWLEVGAGRLAFEAGGGTCQCGTCQCERFRSAIRACREEG